MMRALVLGADGQVGHECVAVLRLFADVVGVVEGQLDITDGGALVRTLREVRPDVVVNAAAYTNVDAAETDEERARAVNARAVAVLGEEASRLRYGLVHFSTDFVFDGTKGAPYVEDDVPSPLGAYGRTKLEGELVLRDQGAPAVTLRTAWVYGTRSRSFVSTMLRLARTQGVLRVVSDQRGNPTFCRDLGEAVGLLLRRVETDPYEGLREARGVYHLAGRGACSRHELAEATIALDPRREQHVVREVVPISTTEMPLPARRPVEVDLDGSLAFARFGLRLPPWRESLGRALAG
jgi:dTDP-4-dehydrorhamnose reductase